jgi:predicted transcriptional regulator of viral defense system
MSTLSFYKKLARHRHVTTRDAAQLTEMSIPATSMALRRLAAEGLSIQIKKGHWLLGETSTKMGSLVTAAAAPYQAYLSGWSALRLHGLIQQMPQKHFAITLGRPGEIEMAGTKIELHRIKPELFGGYHYDPRAAGFVASPEKAVFDLAYLATMNRSRVSGKLPETNMNELNWKQVQKWFRRITSPRVLTAVQQSLESLRRQNAEFKD